ncbi:MAG: transposase [Steroidobacteraceae bacterium]
MLARDEDAAWQPQSLRIDFDLRAARMPRKPRLHVDGGFYHVILRGNHRDPIFFHPADRVSFASLVRDTTDRFRMRVHAYCRMSNHVHLLMQVSDVPLGRAMMHTASRFARHIQWLRFTTGAFLRTTLSRHPGGGGFVSARTGSVYSPQSRASRYHH